MTQTADAHNTALFPDAVAHPETWPVIRGIEDIRDHVDPNRGIHLFEQGDFSICRYTSAMPDTFRSAMDLECRCLVFDTATGRLLSRSFHKFFNLGERETLGDIDLDGARLEMKLDGSMIGAFVHADQVVYHTRGGLSDQARLAGATATEGHDALVRDAFRDGYTPIFEFTSPENRVVVSYDHADLTLLALRHRETGAYAPEAAQNLAARHGVAMADIVTPRTSGADGIEAALSEISRRTDIEGVVLVLPDGHRLKIKTRDYLRRHRILGNIAKEKYVYLCYLEDVLDDTAAALGGNRGRALADFVARIEDRVRRICAELDSEMSGHMASLSPADRARKIKQTYRGAMQAAAFAAAAGQDPRGRILEIMARRIDTPEKRDSLKSELGLPDWTVDIQAMR